MMNSVLIINIIYKLRIISILIKNIIISDYGAITTNNMTHDFVILKHHKSLSYFL